MTKQQEHISKFISLILRHKPEAVGITLDSQGWANVQELMNGMKEQGKYIELSDLEIVVDQDSKGRYSFNDDKTKIRANQGHSVKGVDLNLKPLSSKDIPDWLYLAQIVDLLNLYLLKVLNQWVVIMCICLITLKQQMMLDQEEKRKILIQRFLRFQQQRL